MPIFFQGWHMPCLAYAWHGLLHTLPGAQRRRISSQDTFLTKQFNRYHGPEARVAKTRHLVDMLCLPDAQRQAYSFLCQGEGVLYGPLALAVVDPTVVTVDFDNAPADRWHGEVDMIDELTGAIRKNLKRRKLSKVSQMASTLCGTGRHMHMLSMPRACSRRRVRLRPQASGMPGICQAWTAPHATFGDMLGICLACHMPGMAYACSRMWVLFGHRHMPYRAYAMPSICLACAQHRATR